MTFLRIKLLQKPCTIKTCSTLDQNRSWPDQKTLKIENYTAKVGQDNVNIGVVAIFQLANTSLLQVYWMDKCLFIEWINAIIIIIILKMKQQTHDKLNVWTTRKKSEPQMGFEPTTLRDLVGCSNHWATGDSMVSKGQFMGLHWNRITRLHSQVMTVTHELTNSITLSH